MSKKEKNNQTIVHKTQQRKLKTKQHKPLPYSFGNH